MTFDPDLHEYRDGDMIIHSVTQILKGAGIIDDQWYTEESRERGSAVHTLCERYAQGIRFDDNKRSLLGLEYINSFAAWMRYSHAYAIATECKIDHVINGYRYAGKFDLFAEIAGERILIDLKTGAKAKWHTIQLAAYALAINPDKAMILYLKANGKYIQSWLTPGELVNGIAQFKDAIATR